MQVLLALGLGFLTSQLALFATTISTAASPTTGSRRPATAMPFRIILWVTTGIRPREWAGVHRRHHAALDTVDDPHSPARVGFWNVQLVNIVMYHRAARDRSQVDRYTRDVHKDRLDRYVFDRETLGPLLGLGFLCLVLGWQTGLLAGLLHLVFYVALNSTINAWGHTFGRRPQVNSATNGRLLARLLTVRHADGLLPVTRNRVPITV